MKNPDGPSVLPYGDKGLLNNVVRLIYFTCLKNTCPKQNRLITLEQPAKRLRMGKAHSNAYRQVGDSFR